MPGVQRIPPCSRKPACRSGTSCLSPKVEYIFPVSCYPLSSFRSGLSVEASGGTGLLSPRCFGWTRRSNTRPGPPLLPTRGLILRFTPSGDRIGDTCVARLVGQARPLNTTYPPGPRGLICKGDREASVSRGIIATQEKHLQDNSCRPLQPSKHSFLHPLSSQCPVLRVHCGETVHSALQQ